ncbi:MAG: class I SAM-dependent methyltransferase [Dehalococcoidia bacterium]|nr:class I SAM-dependent methyltransferase [Dehalococcoidia bacterium]
MSAWRRAASTEPVITGLYRERMARYRLARRYAVGQDVLDCAPAPGAGTASLAAVARHVTVVTPQPSAVQRAVRRYHPPNLHYLVGDVAAFGLAPQSYDLVVAFEVWELGIDLPAHLAAVRRLLRPGGYYLASSPNRRWATAPRTAVTPPPPPANVTLTEMHDLLLPYFAIEGLLGQSSLALAQLTHTASYLQLSKQAGVADLAERAAAVAGPATDESLYFVAVCRRRFARE